MLDDWLSLFWTLCLQARISVVHSSAFSTTRAPPLLTLQPHPPRPLDLFYKKVGAFSRIKLFFFQAKDLKRLKYFIRI